nr:Mu transposase C-terminal domain-containing protein [Myxosarcina sp. GI1]
MPKAINRSIYRDGYIRFENLIYKGENLAGYAGEQIALRYDPSDITQVLVYRREQGKDIFLARAFAQDLETETLSLEDIKATNKKIRDKGKSISNHSILEEVKERDLFVAKKTTKKEKRKQEQFEFDEGKVSTRVIETESEIEETTTYVEPEPVEILDYEDAMDEFGW